MKNVSYMLIYGFTTNLGYTRKYNNLLFTIIINVIDH